MTLIKNEYDFSISIPDDINVSWNIIQEDSLLDIDTYLKTLSIKNDLSLVVLWGAERRIPVTDPRIKKLNLFKKSIPNPMLLVNGSYCPPSKNLIEFAYANIDIFKYASSRFFRHLVPSTDLRTHKFLFASSKDYLSRRYLLQALLNNNISGHVAYKCDVVYHEKEFYPNDLDEISQAGKTIDHLLPIQGFDDLAHFPSIPESVINSSLVSIVMETYFNGPVYFSEKIYNSMLFNHLFIYLGPPNSLKHLQEQGFKTFGHVIDESYDLIEDDARRLFAVKTSMINFLLKPIEELRLIHKQNQHILDHNRNLVLSYDISDAVTKELQQAIQDQ